MLRLAVVNPPLPNLNNINKLLINFKVMYVTIYSFVSRFEVSLGQLN